MRTSILKKRKLIFNFAVGLILSVVFLMSVSAQNKTITAEEFETVKSKAAKKLEQISYRSVTIQKRGKLTLANIYEFVPPNREHFITTTESTEDLTEKLKVFQIDININMYEEWIYIGKKTYSRNVVNKKWKEIVYPWAGGNGDGQGKGSGIGYGQGDRTFSLEPNQTIEFKLTPNQFVNGQESDLYEVTESYKYSWDSEPPSVYSYKYWITKNGLFAKTQYIDSDMEETVSFEYISNIKIEAPVIKKRTKRNR